MAAVTVLRAFLRLRRTATQQHTSRLIKVQSRSVRLKPSVTLESECLLQNLNVFGVNVKEVRQHQPVVRPRSLMNQKGLVSFLEGKGAGPETIVSIINRYPRAIIRSTEHMEERWSLWRNIIQTDAEIVTIVDRSPESFFRSSDNENLAKNIDFLLSLGLNTEVLYRMLTTAPRTLSNSFNRNKQMVDLLEDTNAELGGKNPKQFVEAVLSNNFFILITSTKKVKKNIQNLQSLLKLSDSQMLDFLQGPGAQILGLSNEYLKNNFTRLEQIRTTLDCPKLDIKELVICLPAVLFSRTSTITVKLDRLLKGGIAISQILGKPKVLQFSVLNITQRLEKLCRVKYDFQENGISILEYSKKRFDAKLEKLALLPYNK